MANGGARGGKLWSMQRVALWAGMLGLFLMQQSAFG